jgi:flavodoxin
MALAKIVYASMTGNTEEIADIVAKNLRHLVSTLILTNVRLLMHLILQMPTSQLSLLTPTAMATT